MSELQVTTVSVNNTTNATAVSVGNTVINSAGIYLGSGGIVNTSSLSVSRSDLNYTTSAEFNNSSDSYTAQNATITNFDTYIRLTGTGTDPILRTPSFSYHGTEIGKIIIKIRRIAGSGWDGSVFYETSGHGESESFKFLMSQPSWVGTDWAFIELDGNRLLNGGTDFINNTITRMRFDFGTSASDIFDIDYIRFYPVNILTNNVSVKSITIGGNTVSVLTESVNVQIFTANGTWTKPSWATDGKELVVAHLWGGGGNGSAGNGGGGGAFVFGYFIANNLSATQSVVVGLATQNSSFANLVAYGGATPVSPLIGGGGGGWISAGAGNGPGGAPLGGSFGAVSTFGGGGGGDDAAGGSSIYGGGGGGGNGNRGGDSVFGGAGGSGSNSTTIATSVYGGSGANTLVAAQIPGGGGAGNANNSAGARGEVRIYTYRILS